MPQQAAAESTRDQCVSWPETDSSVATITSSAWSSRLRARDTSELAFSAMPTIRTRPENLPTGLLLAGAGGFLDAYTFVGRGGVFANAQTGNIVLLAVAAGERHWQAALLHVPPILAFMLGVALAETLARPAARRTVRRPARFVLVAEIERV